MLKSAGSPCPKCAEPFCSEYAQMGKPARWTCQHCGSSGDITGGVSVRGQAKPATQPKPHWKA